MIEAGILLIVIAFCILVLYLIQLIRSLQKSLLQVDIIMGELQNSVGPLAEETVKLLQNSNSLAESVNQKINAFDPLFQSISNLGEIAEESTEATKKKFHAKHLVEESQKKEWTDTLAELVELVAFGAMAWHQYQKRK